MRYLIVLMIALLIPSAALAKGECKEDKAKFCKGMDKTELKACLKAHEAELSESCKASREAKAKAKQSKENAPEEPASMGEPRTDAEHGGAQPPDTKQNQSAEPQ